MILGKVVARVVASEKCETLPSRQLLQIEPLEGFGDRSPIVAIDSVAAGPGDLVLVLQEGTGARQAVLPDPSQPLPAQMVVIGIVDEVHRG
jgi:microcompartment protein CcmK/EutM